MTKEKMNYDRAASAVAKMAEQLETLKMRMPAELAWALQMTANSLETAQVQLNKWHARLAKSSDNPT